MASDSGFDSRNSFVYILGSYSSKNMSVFVRCMCPTTRKARTRGIEWMCRLMASSVCSSSITMDICTMFWQICVVLMATSRLIHNTAFLFICSLPRGHKSTGRRQLQSRGKFILFVTSLPSFLVSLCDRYFLFLVLSFPGQVL